MPDEHEYRVASRRLRRLADRLVRDAGSVRSQTDPTHIAGGPVRTVLERALDDADGSIRRAVSELERLATICDRRAEICADHLADLLRHRRLTVAGGTVAPPPTAPAWWVET